MMSSFRCRTCFEPYPMNGLPHCCPNCGDLFTLRDLIYSPPVLGQDLSVGIWRYRGLFGLPSDCAVSYLGEGNTPLVATKIGDRHFWCKLESLNPSGSFKDRATAVLVSILRARGIENVVEDSSGNAGGSLALYCSAFGIGCRVYVPSGTSGQKRRQIEACGADVIQVEGPRENAHQAVLKAIQQERLPYASHAAQPFGLAGIATIAFEIFEEMGEMPGTVFCPIGHGSLFTGIIKGFDALVRTGVAAARPRMIGVQPEACDPVVASWQGEVFTDSNGASLAEGTMVEKPARAVEILQMLDHTRDRLVSVSEAEIAKAHRMMIQAGFYVEPTSAMVLAASERCTEVPGKSILILSGSELKLN